MIGGAELEPGSGMFSPHKFPTEDVHAAISEREMLAAQYRNSANDSGALEQEASRQNQARSDALAHTGCRKHVDPMNSFSETPDRADPSCPSCKRAQTKYLRESPRMATPSAPADVKAQHLNYADHFAQSADALRAHLRGRNAALN